MLISLCINMFYELSGIAAYNAIWWHIFGNHRICTHDRVLAYPHAREDRRCHAYPHTLFYMYGLAIVVLRLKGLISWLMVMRLTLGAINISP